MESLMEISNIHELPLLTNNHKLNKIICLFNWLDTKLKTNDDKYTIKVGLAENRARLAWRLFYIISGRVLPGNETGARASAGAESQPGQ